MAEGQRHYGCTLRQGYWFLHHAKDQLLSKVKKILNGPQFKAINFDSDFTIKQETKFYKQFSAMMKRGDISKQFYQKVRPVGSQPARLYGLAEVHKKESPLGPILSMPGSQYEKL